MRQSHTKIAIFTFIVVCSFIVLQLNLSIKSQDSEPTPVYIETVLGRLPNNCVPGPEPMTVSRSVAPVVGGYPAWVTMSGPNASVIFLEGHPAHEQAAEYGYPHKILWIMRSTYRGVVTLTGENLATRQPIYFQLNTQTSPTTELQLQITNRVDFPGTIFIPAAGCYSLQAEWDGGLWRINFAAGEISEADWQATATAQASD